MPRTFLRHVVLLILSCGVPCVAGNLQSWPDRWVDFFASEDLPKLEYPVYYTPLERAGAQCRAGRYRLALATLAGTDGKADAVGVALVKADALAALGRSGSAEAILANPEVVNDARVGQRQAQLLLNSGDNAGALSLLRKLVADRPQSMPARVMLAEAALAVGDQATARSNLDWFIVEPQSLLVKWTGQGTQAFADAESLTSFGRALDHWAELTGEFRGNPSLVQTVLDIFIKAYDQMDREYLPAHLAAADFLIRHGNPADAQKELSAVLNVNPNHVEAMKMLAELAIRNRQVESGEQIVAQLRRLDPESVTADLLDIRCLLLRRQYAQAMQASAQVLERRPGNIEVLGLLASAQILLRNEAGMTATLARVDKINPHDASAYVAVADQLLSRYQHHPAESLYLKAIERAPFWNAPRNGLGVLYTQAGQEDKARAVLEAARQIDPFNLETTNFLRVLDQMQAFHRTETDHFIFLYSADDDPIVPLYFAPYMERVYTEVTKDFRHAPKQKTLIEIFPTAAAFSVRTAGMTGLESFGASFGPVISAVAPRAGETLGKFNWARVLRHEFTHVMNMSATDGRCPRWLTEGLAVWQEKVAYRFDWVPPVLYRAAADGKLWGVREMEQRFASQKSPTDGEMAYMEGLWIVEFLCEKHGPDAIVKLLAAYGQGLEDEPAIKQATGQTLAEFEPAFFSWARQRVANWGYDKATAEKFKAAFDEGEQRLKASLFQQAIESFLIASKLQPLNPQPHRRLAGLYLKLKQPQLALEHIQWLIPLELQDNRYAKRVARVYQDAHDLTKAIEFAGTAVQIDPFDPLAHELLADLYTQSDSPLAAQERDVARLLTERQKAKTSEP